MEPLQVHFIIEILGRPADNVTQALNLITEKLKTEEGVSVMSVTVHEPKLAKDSKDLYTSFAEIDLEVKSMHVLLGLLFSYMPANIEISYPEQITLSNQDLNNFANQLMHRLHQYDAITKKALLEKDFLTRKLYEIAPQLFKKAPSGAEEEKSSKEEIKPKKSSSKKKKL